MIDNIVLTSLNSFLRAPFSGAANIVGLAIGLALIFIVTSFASYERGYDGFFERADRIYGVYPVFAPGGPLGVRTGPTSPPAAKPLFDDVAAIEASATVYAREYRVRNDGQLAYQQIRFVDPRFFDIFNLDLIAGSLPQTPEAADWIMLSESTAERYFGDASAVNQTLELDAQRTAVVVGIFRDLPRNSHFTTSLIGNADFEMLAATALLEQLSSGPLNQHWYSISTDDSIYVLLRPGALPEDLSPIIDERVEGLVPERARELFETFRLRPLKAINLYPSEAAGLPLLAIVQGLAALVLIGTVLNYSNIATAQAFSRFREAAVRRTLGALRRDIAAQAFGESMILVTLATVLALSVSFYVLSLIAAALDRDMPLVFFTSPSWLLSLVGILLVTALAAAVMPTVVLVRLNVADVFRQASQRDGGAITRGLMVAVQTILAIILTAIALVASIQYQSVDQRTGFFDRSSVFVLDRYPEELRGQYDALRRELERVPHVESVAGANFVPFELAQANIELGRVQGDSNKQLVRYVSADEDWPAMFGLRTLSGRALDRNRDAVGDEPGAEVGLLLNETSARLFGWANPADAVNQVLYRQSDGQAYRVAGVLEDENVAGALAAVPALAITLQPTAYNEVAVALVPGFGSETLDAVEAAWASVYPSYPVHWRTMDEFHSDTHSLLASVGVGIGGLAMLAVALSAYGMLSLARLLVRRREREIAVRKTLGASRGDVFKLLLGSFSKPIVVSFLIGLPISFLIIQLYLGLYEETARISPLIILLIPVLFAALTIILVLGQAWAVISRPAAVALRAE